MHSIRVLSVIAYTIIIIASAIAIASTIVIDAALYFKLKTPRDFHGIVISGHEAFV